MEHPQYIYVDVKDVVGNETVWLLTQIQKK